MAEKLRILLVDDEKSITMLDEARLQHAGYAVLIATNGQEALETAHRERPDLMILDLMLPKLNGYEVCTMLKQDTRYQKIPIIMFTAKAQEKDEKLGLECGADAYIRKPFDPKEFLGKIRALLPVSPAGPAAVQPDQVGG